MLTAKHPNQLPPEGKMAGGRECRTCEFAQQCLGFLPWVQKTETKIKSSQAKAKLKDLSWSLTQAEKAIEAARQAKASAEMHLYAELAKNKTNFASFGGLTIVAKKTKEQRRYNAKRMAERLVKLGDDPEKYREPTKPGASLTVEWS